jgi:hypothetical protein
MNETIFSILQGDDDSNRVVIVHRSGFGGSSLVLRRETFSDDIGWFEQSSVEISPDQVGQLKQALGGVPSGQVRPVGRSRQARDHRSMATIAMVSQHAG